MWRRLYLAQLPLSCAGFRGSLLAMKIFISADMEGVAGVSARDEVTKGEVDYAAAQAQMTAEVRAASLGAFSAGASEVWIKDAHWTGRNLDPAGLPAPEGKRLRLIRGWSGHPFSMVQGLDATFEAVGFVGYHSSAARGGNPLAHTLSSRLLAAVRVNGELLSEFQIFSWAASTVGVRVGFLAGDRALCETARRMNETIVTVETFEGVGASIVTLPPLEAVQKIQEGMARAVRDKAGRVLPLPKRFDVALEFHDHAEAYRRSFYPGARPEGDFGVGFQSENWFEVLRLLKFMTL